MDGQEHLDTGDEFDVEVSDVHGHGDTASPPPARSPLQPRLTPRRRLVRLAITLSAGLLALVVVLGSTPAVRGGVTGLFARLIPTPMPTLAPGADLFYLLPNPPGVGVSLDGRALAHLPFPGDPHPLRLAPGQHVLSWRSHVLPFKPLECRVSVPGASGDTCAFVSYKYFPQALADLPGHVIALHVSLAALPPSDATLLTQAIQQALDASRSTALVQPGERYFYYQPGQSGAPVVARQPLLATLSYQFGIESGYPEPCILGQPAIPCRFAGQDCGQLCTVAQPPPTVAGAANTWVVAAVVSGAWDYVTLDGQVVARQIRDPLGAQLAVLRITLDGAGWQVTPLFGHTPGLDVTDDAVCDPARYALQQTPSWNFMLTYPPPGATVQFASDATPADGCVALLDQSRVPSQPAVFLERFGVLLTVNDEAKNPSDNLPTADSAELSLAHRLAAQAQLTF